ncbi:MAG: hypothetical protein ACOY3L_03915 [Pseudomonadota bacterium]
MEQFGIGRPVRRTEDPRFLTGRGRYADDITLPRADAMPTIRFAAGVSR